MISTEPLRYRAYRCADGGVRIATVETSCNQLARKHRRVVLVRPTHTGICSADIRELRGERPGRTDFGHEVVGTVLDSTHPQFSGGDTVVMNPFVKIERETAFAETMYLAGSDEMLAAALIKVPSDDMRYSIVEPLSCAIHAARRASLGDTGPGLVLGAGFFGYLLYCYLEYNGLPVRLANRTPDRLADLGKRVPGLQTVLNLEECAERFATVFLMQTRVTREDIAAASRLVREHGEVVLFGAVDRGTDPDLYATRSQEQRRLTSQGEKKFHLQGTLDASLADLQEAIAMLGRPDFVQKVAPIFAPSLTFEQGADHLTQRAASPRSLRKYVINMRS